MLNPFRSKKPNPKRKQPRRVRGRERLNAAGMQQLRYEAYKRSRGACEFVWDGVRCNARIDWESMQLCHKQHGPRKTDTIDEVLAGCADCHQRSHNCAGKPVPRKPGRVMKKAEAQAYLLSTKCFCGQPKITRHVFCDSCNDKLSPQTRLDLKELTHREWLEAVADAEQQILAYGT